MTGYSQRAVLDPSLNRNEYIVAFGPSQFLGDLGGSAQIGTHFLKDWNAAAIRYGGYLGYRYKICRPISIKAALTMGELYGNDALSNNPVRFNRDQNFRSIIIEPSVQGEFHFYQHDHLGHRYKIKHAHGFQAIALDAYLFAGVGLFYYNPQGKYINGKWYDLRPLSTEGEGLPGGPHEYSPIAVCVPAGLGVRYVINAKWSVGMELSDRLWTSTDYIDDTHGNYFNKQEIEKYKGPIAAYFSAPTLGLIPGQDLVGQERGDPTHNDTYMFLFFTVNYHLVPKARKDK